MKFQNEDVIIVNLLKQAVESEGCKLEDVDIEKNVLMVNGPDEAIEACARAVAEIMD